MSPSKPVKNRPTEAADAVRAAVDRTFQATVGQAQVTRERAQELVDEVVSAAGRVREVLDDLRVASGDDVRALRGEIARLEERVARLERAAAKPAGAAGSGGPKARKGDKTAKDKTAKGKPARPAGKTA